MDISKLDTEKLGIVREILGEWNESGLNLALTLLVKLASSKVDELMARPERPVRDLRKFCERYRDRLTDSQIRLLDSQECEVSDVMELTGLSKSEVVRRCRERTYLASQPGGPRTKWVIESESVVSVMLGVD